MTSFWFSSLEDVFLSRCYQVSDVLEAADWSVQGHGEIDGLELD